MAKMDDKNKESSFKEAVRQFVEQQLSGNKPDIQELISKFPEHEHQIRRKIKEFHKVDSLFGTLIRTDQSDFAYMSDEYDLVGKTVGGFKIEQIIGRGGMGVVYLARDTRLDRSVAVKSIPGELHSSSTAQARFEREAKLLATLNHPNIAVIHDIIEEDKSSYLILEHVAGETLAQRIAREPLTHDEALSIGQQIAEAISAAHKKGIIHRDLKPGNIKITPEGKVKVLDFGLAKISIDEGENTDNTVTQPGRVIGTPAYMSPEQARGKPADKRSDIWSFGCIMYQMLTGKFPFEGETATDTLARIIERQPDWELLPQDTPMNMRTLLRRCLEKDPEKRLGEIAEAAVEISDTLRKPQITPPSKLKKTAMITGSVIIVIILTGVALKFLSNKEIPPSLKQIRLVVLPFENLGPSEDEYFADGIADAITARLAGIHGLSVISRQSAIQYKASKKDTRQIAEELGVDYILEGTVQREQPAESIGRVRIIPQLINASEDTHVWTEIYDDDMSKVFRLQSDLAEHVAQALDIALLEPERKVLDSRPTENMEAYEYYLRGFKYSTRGMQLENDIKIAIRMLERAVELDPNFALAYTRLCINHLNIYKLYYDKTDERFALAKQALDKAVELAPDLLETQLALGHYYTQLDLDRALEQFESVRKIHPNNPDAISMTAYLHRSQGNFEQSTTYFNKLLEIHPCSCLTLTHTGFTLSCMCRYQEAERYFNRAILEHPDQAMPYLAKAWNYVRWEGDTEKAKAVLAEALQNFESTENPFVNPFIELEVLDRNYSKALDWLSKKSEDRDDIKELFFIYRQYAQIYGYMGKNEPAKKYYDKARSILESKMEKMPKDKRLHGWLGIAYAGLGCKEDAVRQGKLAVETAPVNNHAIMYPFRIEELARIYVMVGEYDKAIEKLENLMSIPGPFSIHHLRLDPAWDPLRNHPRFKKLIDQDK